MMPFIKFYELVVEPRLREAPTKANLLTLYGMLSAYEILNSWDYPAEEKRPNHQAATICRELVSQKITDLGGWE